MEPDVIQRYEGNPVLSARDIPYDAVQIFNAGVAKWRGRYVMLFRNDYGYVPGSAGPIRTNLGLATSDDGLCWTPEPHPCLAMKDEEICRVYDPRLTVIDGSCYVCLAVDTRHGLRGAVAVTDNFEHFEFLSLSLPDNRNMALFPEKIDGKFVRLERPMPVYSRERAEAFDMWLSDSPDLRYWGNHRLVLGAEQVPYCNNKIGPAAPPIRTDCGWLALFHSVYKDDSRPLGGWERRPWTKCYSAGLVLLDLDRPWRVIGMSREPVLSPQAKYELEGFRGSAIFPGGMILEDDGEVKIYYGAADTVVALATARVDDLLDLCEPV